ncbi:hypothetical protein [Kineococcus esterisolvens]|uniref:hypothetical protein n=1 Tax=unclassified Kineococcus TaxID=2621656 RepID=UPI003D7E44CB
MSGNGDEQGGLLVGFDVDCGEVVTGRHLHLRGLRDEGSWPDAAGNRPPAQAGGPWQMVSLDYEIVPPVHEDDADAGQWFVSPLADVEYEVAPPLRWDVQEAGNIGGGSTTGVLGQPYSRGSYGPYPLPDDARQVVFTLTPYLDRRPGEETGRGGPDFVVEAAEQPLGRVVIDVRAGAARWEPLPAME